MKKKQHGIEKEPHGAEPPLFICQDRQCHSPMMTRVYIPEGSPPLDERWGSGDLREDIPVKKRIPNDRPDRY
ncbi:MAG TPA: hypothetical protein VGK23_06115 [Methanomassiliicoccales archaeon]|jgi:hypothetical protein